MVNKKFKVYLTN